MFIGLDREVFVVRRGSGLEIELGGGIRGVGVELARGNPMIISEEQKQAQTEADWRERKKGEQNESQ